MAHRPSGRWAFLYRLPTYEEVNLATFIPPTVSYPLSKTGNLLIDRISQARGLCVITDGAGGWTTKEFPWLGELGSISPITSQHVGLTEGTDYFLGGHVYPNLDPTVAASLQAAGFTVLP